MDKYRIGIRIKRGLQLPFKRNWIRKVIYTALRLEDVDYHLELSVMLTDDSGIQRLNRRYRSIDRPTDVLSFAFMDEGGSSCQPQSSSSTEFPLPIGEIIISLPTAIRQASERGNTLQREMAVLLIHGTLHLLGHDHIKSRDARRMEKREESVINSIDFNGSKL